MLVGIPPFYNDNISVLYQNIAKGKLKVPQYLSKNAKAILQNLLNKDPSKRPTMAQLKKDPYFEGIDWDKLAHKKYRPPVKLGKPDKSNSGKKEDLASIFHESITSSSAGQGA